MKILHRHNWVRIKETYAPPLEGKFKTEFEGLAEKLLLGVTTILWECSICQALRREEMLGKELK